MRRFTHVDPFEDTESLEHGWDSGRFSTGFTHVDPFEDTESPAPRVSVKTVAGFTHVDPFEDTERLYPLIGAHSWLIVSPTSIRSRILKGTQCPRATRGHLSFTHVDPFEDTERSGTGC